MNAPAAPGTFSEHWHRVGCQELSLRPTVRATRQVFRGEKWVVLHDSFHSEYFRISPAAYAFVSRLEQGRTVEQVWETCMDADPENAPGQEEALQLLAQLYQSNLLRGALPPDSASLFARYRKRRSTRLRSTLANLMFAQIPLFDPDAFLCRALPYVRPLLTRAGAILWLGAIGLALGLAVSHWTELASHTEGLLAPENWLLLYTATFFVKAIHELGHAFVCRNYGGAVHRLGFMLMIFTPLPFVDATASWGFSSRRQRVFVASAGMIAELFVAAGAMFVWTLTGPGILHGLAYNTLIVASLTTLVFNGNPLLRYDGYYIFSDLAGVPNLGSRAQQHLQYLVQRHVFGVAGLESPAASRGEGMLLGIYGVASGIYRLLVFSAIIWFVSGKYLLLGLILAAVFLFKAAIMPVARFVGYLFRDRRLERTRGRAVGITLGVFAGLALLLGIIPFPHSFCAPGILEAERCTEVFSTAPGDVETQPIPSGSRVTRGQMLLRLKNEALQLEMDAATAERRGALASRDRAMDHSSAELKPIAGRLEAIDRHIAELQQRLDGLTLTAPHDGLWICSQNLREGSRWLRRGEPAGWLIDTSQFHFLAVVPQSDAAALFSQEIRGAEIRIVGEAGKGLRAQEWHVTPGEQERLPSPALGWLGGGPVALLPGDRTGLNAATSFYEVRAAIAPEPGAMLLHGRFGKIRFRLPRSPLLTQWAQRLAQLVQERPAL